MNKQIKVVAFDADDTLWANEPYFQEAQQKFGKIISQWIDSEDVVNEHYQTEKHNLPIYGYGIKGFTLSLIDTALRISQHQINSKQIEAIINIGKEMHRHPVKLIDGVEQVLEKLGKHYRLIVATKGDLLDQERKLQRSNLEHHFHHVEVMSEKTESHYQKLLNHLDIEPHEFVMVGNALKSDIQPVLNIGGFAIHIPFHISWIHEEMEHFDNSHPRFAEFESISLIHEFFQRNTFQ